MAAPPYPKIENLYASLDGGEARAIGVFKRPERTEQIARWLCTEKIDGTNIRISLEPEKQIHHRRGMPSSVRDMEEGERGFVGGMVEADGNVGLYARARVPDKGQWEFNVVNTDPELLSALIRATGAGTVTVQHMPENEAQRVTYKWSVNRFNDMKAIAEQCRDYSQKMQPLLQAKGATEFIAPVPWVVRFYGRTNRADMTDDIQEYLRAAFTVETLERLWQCRRNCEKCGGSGTLPGELGGFTCENVEPYPITLYGEAYGAGIQKGGGDYRKDGDISFRLFDVLVGDHWLTWNNVMNVAHDVGVQTVPFMGFHDTEDIVSHVQKGFFSRVAAEEGIPRLAEGIVACTDPYLFDNNGRRVVFKTKTKDY